MIINYFGMEIHPTDVYIYWTEKKKEKEAKRLREAYDKITASGLEKELKVLLTVAYESGGIDESEAHAEEDF